MTFKALRQTRLAHRGLDWIDAALRSIKEHLTPIASLLLSTRLVSAVADV